MFKFNAIVSVAWLWVCTTAHAVDAVPNLTDAPADEDAVQTVSDATAHVTPDSAAAIAFSVPAATRLTWVAHVEKDGFYRAIRKDKGPQGWVAAAAVKITHERVHGQSVPVAACAASMDECPARGCAAAGTSEAIANAFKRNKPADELRATLSFDDFAQLQRQADALVSQGPSDISIEQRAALSGLKVSGGTVSEGDLVRAVGYIAKGDQGLHVNGAGESVNCNLKHKSDNDFHIPLVDAAGDSEFKGIVVEMNPQKRPLVWTIDTLKEIQAQGAQVWVEGGLSYDNVHYVNADPDNPLKDEPDRMSLWEIHPITKFLVCRKDHCDPSKETDWLALDAK